MEVPVHRRFVSRLRGAPAVVFAHATSLDGINAELRPFRMTAPPGLRSLTDGDARFRGGVPLNEVLFTSWVMLGPIPIDRLRLRLVELDLERRRFVESSDVLSMRLWRHEREVRALEEGCELADVLTFEPKVRAATPALARFVDFLFARRHAVIRRVFGAAS